MNSQNLSCQAAAPLLLTKLYPAHAEDAPQLERVALLERLLDASEQRLIVLSAPAGFGKSTVLSQLRSRLQGQGTRVAWLSCDESDSEPARFLQYLIAAIALQLPGFGQGTKQLLRSEVSLSNDTLLESFIDELGKVERDLPANTLAAPQDERGAPLDSQIHSCVPCHACRPARPCANNEGARQSAICRPVGLTGTRHAARRALQLACLRIGLNILAQSIHEPLRNG